MKFLNGEIDLPSDGDSERLVLGACLNDADAVQQVVDTVQPEDFSAELHRVIYRSILELFHSGRHVDRETVAKDLRKSGQLEKVGGLTFLITLECPALVGLNTYLRYMRETAIVRRGILEAGALIDSLLCYKHDSGAILATAEKLVHVLSAAKDKSDRPKTVYDIVQDAGGTEEFLKPQGYGIQFPFKILNKTLMGLRKRRLIFCAARPGVGKTALMEQIAESAALQGYRALVVSAEMDATDIVHRSICGRAEASMYRFVEGTLSENDRDAIYQQLMQMVALEDNLLFDDAPSITMQRISSMLRYQQSIGKPVDLLLIDYVQLLDSNGKSENRTLELARISKALVRIKKQFQIPIFTLAQISREGAKEDEPSMIHMKECGQLEQDADSVLLLWVHKKEQEFEALDPRRPSTIINWKLDKNRGGWRNRGGHDDKGGCHYPLVFWKSRARFEEDLVILPREVAA